MANPLYSMLMGSIPQQSVTSFPQNMSFSPPMFQNPLQKMNYIMQAMSNPAAFVRQNLPEIPNEILNDPNQILQYMKQNMGLTDQDIRNASMQIPPRFR